MGIFDDWIKHETLRCDICSQVKDGRTWRRCFNGHQICATCLTRTGAKPGETGEARCPVCQAPLR